MPITIEEQRQPNYPVVKRQAIGEVFHGALVRQEQRPVMKKNPATDAMEVQLKKDGKPRHELVLTMVAMPGTTAEAGIGGINGVPKPGDPVRLILRGGAFGEWIEARRAHPELTVGDVVTQKTTYAQCFNQDGDKTGNPIETQEELSRVPRGKTVGIYGPVSIRSAAVHEADWVAKAEELYLATQQRIAVEPSGSGYVDPYAAGEEPF